MKATTYQLWLKKIEGLLWSWGLWRRIYKPAPPISRVYEDQGPPTSAPRTSQQERHLLEHQQEIAVEAVIFRQEKLLRELAFWRYVENEPLWPKVARRLYVSKPEVYRLRRELLGVISDAVKRGEIPV